MSQAQPPQQIRSKIGDGRVSRGNLYDLLIYHLHMRNWDDYPRFRWEPSSPPTSPSRILIIELSSIGDVTYTLPTIHSAVEKWPNADVDFLCEQECAVSVEDHPDLSELWRIPSRRWRRWNEAEEVDKTRNELRAFVNRLRKRRYDYVINLHWNPFPAVLTNILDPADINGLTVNDQLEPTVAGNPINKLQFENMRLSPAGIPLNRASLKRLCSDVPCGDTDFYIREHPATKEKTREMYHDRKRENTYHVLVNTGSRMEKRRWPADHCARVLKELGSNLSIEIGLIGGGSDVERLHTVREQLPDTIPVTPWYEITDNLMEDVYLSDLADLTISTDSGPLHLVSIRGNVVLDIAGDRWVGPWNKESLLVQNKNKEVTSIPPAEIVRGVRTLLGNEDVPVSTPETNWFRSPLPVSDFWFRHQKLGTKNRSEYMNWLSGMLSLRLWSDEAQNYGWSPEPITSEEFQRLHKLFWERDVEDVSPDGLEITGGNFLSDEIRGRVPDILEEWGL